MANPTYFDGKKSFKDIVMLNGEIPTNQFLEACEATTPIFSLLSGFSPIQSDMNGNIKKVRDRLLSHPAQSGTLQELVKNEMAEKKKTASEGLLWLNRGLYFTAVAFRKSQTDPTGSLKSSFQNAYGETLKKHHNMFISASINTAMGIGIRTMGPNPTNDIFLLQLRNEHQDDSTKTKANAQIEEWLTSLDLCVDILNKWIEGLGI